MKPLVMERVHACAVALWAAYLALAPVVYLFGVEEQVDLRALKVGLILGAAAQIFAYSLLSGRVGIPLFPFGLPGLAVLGLLMIPGVVQAPWPLPALDPLLDLTMAALVGWSFYRMRRDGWPVAGLLRGAAAAVATMAAVYVVHALFVAPQGQGVCAWDPVEMHRLFGHSNAGWAASLAAFAALVAFLGIGGAGTLLRGRLSWWTGALLLSMTAALVVSGGRAGMLVAAGVLLLASIWGLRRPAALALTALTVAVAATFWQPECAQSDRTENARAALGAGDERAGVNDGLFRRLNTLTTGRMVGYADAVEKIGHRPLFGWGWRQVRVDGWQGNTPEVHNLYLKVALYCGIPAAAALVGLIGWLGICWWRWQRRCGDDERPLARACGAVLLAGVGISMAEPGTLVGSFQYLSLWWAAAGVVMAGAGGRELVWRRRKIAIIPAD